MIGDTAVLKKLAAIKEIPTLPEIMQEVMAAVASDDSSAEDLAVILSKDQALCSKVLKVANSAFFAQRRKIFDIGDAIVVLGFDSIVQLMLTTSVFKLFGSMRPQKGFDLYGFWKHSIATAVAAKMIADTVGKTFESKAVYTAGLLHDIGKLVLVSHFSDRYAAVFEKLESEHLFVYEAEKAVLGFTHCEVSEWLCNRWNFPEKLVRWIADHHHDVSPESQMDLGARIVRLANIFCNRLQIGNSGDMKAHSLNREEYSATGLADGSVASVENKLEESAKEIESILKALA